MAEAVVHDVVAGTGKGGKRAAQRFGRAVAENNRLRLADYGLYAEIKLQKGHPKTSFSNMRLQ
jgi:hypothetical protein